MFCVDCIFWFASEFIANMVDEISHLKQQFFTFILKCRLILVFLFLFQYFRSTQQNLWHVWLKIIQQEVVYIHKF